MAAKQINMTQLKQVLRLVQQGHSIKGIVRETGISRNTVRNYLRIINSRNLNLDEILHMEDPKVEHLLQTPLRTEKERFQDFLSRADGLLKELGRPHVTRQLLWEEYKREYPDGYQYSRFCYHLQQYDNSRKLTMVGTHSPGDKLQIDYSGKKMHYVVRSTGELIQCEVFVATMGYSNYTSVVATHSQKIEDTIGAVVETLEQLGGSPKAIVPDNLKAAVTKADRYEPVVNETFLDMANHYGMSVLPTRAAKPKDKAKVERAVAIVYQRVMAPLRNTIFYSLKEINDALLGQARLLNDRGMQQLGVSRRELFESDERPLLRPLPVESYELKQQLKLTVQNNYHVYLSRRKQYYSVPYRYVTLKVLVIVTSSLIRVYHKGGCIATHDANSQSRYNTIEDHMPSHHRIVLKGMSEITLRSRALEMGTAVDQVIERVLAQSRHPEQAYKSCQGILALARKTTVEKLVECCSIALEYNVCNYRQIQRLVLGRYANLQLILDEEQKKIPMHRNIRGASNYH